MFMVDLDIVSSKVEEERWVLLGWSSWSLCCSWYSAGVAATIGPAEAC